MFNPFTRARLESHNNIPVNDALIARYLSGEAGPDEAMALHEWLESPPNRSYFEAAQSAWQAARPSHQPRKVNVHAAWTALEHNMKETSARPVKIHWPMIGIAAMITAVIAIGFWLFRDSKTGDMRSLTLSTTDSTRQIELPDQTFIILNRNSTLSYPETFTAQKRQVSLLKGEGFFDVATDTTKPFVVQTGLATIRVVGTAFNVITDKSRVEVSVKEGKVMVYTDHDSTLVGPGFSAQIVKGHGSIRTEPRADVNDWGYATGLFIFKDTPLGEVIAKIEKSFSFTVEIANPDIDNCRLTATFENVSAEKILYLTAETLNLTVERNGRNFTIQGEGCP